MKPKVYIETTVVSYLVARPSRDTLVAARQRITREWWQTRRGHFDLYCSETVNQEASAGDPVFARRRLDALSGIDVLQVTVDVNELAEALVRHGSVPAKAKGDAFHIAIATVYGCDYLLTWNCRHMVNAEIQRRARVIAAEYSYELPDICTPEELLGERE